MNTIDAMKLGVEALKNSKEMIVMTQEMGIRFGVSAQKLKLGEVLIQDRAIAALEQAIKQEEQAKPVAWRYVVNGVWTNYIEIEPPDDAYDKGSLTPLYAIPPLQPVPVKTYSGGKAWPVQTEWIGLTEGEVDEIWGKLLHRDSRALAIEQRLKEKNSKG